MVTKGVKVGHSTIQRWVFKFFKDIKNNMNISKRQTRGSWCPDVTFIKVKGKHMYLYRAVDKNGDAVYFLLTKRRMKGSAQKFLNKAVENNGKPLIINIDKCEANKVEIKTWNKRIITSIKIKVRQIKFLNNIVEQDHTSIKSRISITIGFKEFDSVQRTLAGIEVINIIRKDRILDPKDSTFNTFYSLSA